MAQTYWQDLFDNYRDKFCSESPALRVAAKRYAWGQW